MWQKHSADLICICRRNSDTQLSPGRKFKTGPQLISISLYSLPDISKNHHWGIRTPRGGHLIPPRYEIHLWEILYTSWRFDLTTVVHEINKHHGNVLKIITHRYDCNLAEQYLNLPEIKLSSSGYNYASPMNTYTSWWSPYPSLRYRNPLGGLLRLSEF